MKLTVILASRLDIEQYAARYAAGDGPDRYPYGLENMPPEVELTISRPTEQTRVPTRVRNWISRTFVADVVHGWHNRRAILDADAIYAHTEHEYLAAAAILKLFRRRRVLLTGQTIWLFETFDDYPAWRRYVVRWLLRRVDVFIANAEPNVAASRRVVPGSDHVYIPFGVSKRFAEVTRQPSERPLVLSVGIDRSRDWATFGAAVSGLDTDVRVAANAVIPELDRADVRRTEHFEELLDLYARATCVVVTVVPNLHASGITTVLEAASCGLPVVATAAGGLESYFTGDEVSFAAVGDVAEVRRRILELVEDPAARDRYAAAIKSAYEREQYHSTAYWRRVVDRLGQRLDKVGGPRTSPR